MISNETTEEVDSAAQFVPVFLSLRFEAWVVNCVAQKKRTDVYSALAACEYRFLDMVFDRGPYGMPSRMSRIQWLIKLLSPANWLRIPD